MKDVSHSGDLTTQTPLVAEPKKISIPTCSSAFESHGQHSEIVSYSKSEDIDHKIHVSSCQIAKKNGDLLSVTCVILMQGPC